MRVTDTFTVPSRHHEGEGWRVSRWANADGSNVLVCECPAYDFSKAPKSCAHTRIVAAADAAMDRCSAKGHKDPLCRACLVGLLGAAARKATRLSKKAKQLSAVTLRRRHKPDPKP